LSGGNLAGREREFNVSLDP